ncbi:MAG: hypothetical protein JWQ30_424 [Sediminibacterium sp.]|nr:hypothetical protein [Sediminibacterium sp.]
MGFLDDLVIWQFYILGNALQSMDLACLIRNFEFDHRKDIFFNRNHNLTVSKYSQHVSILRNCYFFTADNGEILMKSRQIIFNCDLIFRF